jgi:hypothetical protein
LRRRANDEPQNTEPQEVNAGKTSGEQANDDRLFESDSESEAEDGVIATLTAEDIDQLRKALNKEEKLLRVGGTEGRRNVAQCFAG